jgi:hypothetical protein
VLQCVLIQHEASGVHVHVKDASHCTSCVHLHPRTSVGPPSPCTLHQPPHCLPCACTAPRVTACVSRVCVKHLACTWVSRARVIEGVHVGVEGVCVGVKGIHMGVEGVHMGVEGVHIGSMHTCGCGCMHGCGCTRGCRGRTHGCQVHACEHCGQG